MPVSEFMSQYKKYRQIVSKEANQTEIEIDTPAISNLAGTFKQKPA